MKTTTSFKSFATKHRVKAQHSGLTHNMIAEFLRKHTIYIDIYISCNWKWRDKWNQ